MSAQISAPILPMQAAGTQHFIERTYRDSGQFQWVRETYVNAIEAKATRIDFGIEWQAVENLGVYRRMIADNGCGMTADQLVEFFNTFGGGGKPIGGPHQNFGVGSKTSLLPWNKYGMVVISWVDGDASMIWVKLDAESGEYGLKVERCAGPNGETTQEGVYDPYDDPDHGCDWSTIKPEWIEDHGTVIVLLGNTGQDDTVEGDPNRGEADIKGLSSYLNRRIWQIPKGVEVFVNELRTNDRASWPPSAKIAHGMPHKGGKDRRINVRSILGARHYIEYPRESFAAGELGAHGTVPLSDGTKVDWYFWEGSRPKIGSYAAIGGYIAAFYRNELYDVSAHHSSYRSFGIVESSVRQRLWLIIRPHDDPDGKRGVYPKTDRNSLLILGGPHAGGTLPVNEWANEFADCMPQELISALKEARHGSSGTITDEEWRERLAERFGSRWRLTRFRKHQGGAERASFDEPLRKGKQKSSESGGSSRTSDGTAVRKAKSVAAIGRQSGLFESEQFTKTGGVPYYRTVGADELDPGMLAGWQPNDPEHPEGVVLINVDHPVIRDVVDYWQRQYPDHHAEAIEHDVIEVYGQVAVSRLAHSEHLKNVIPSLTVERELRSEAALTMSLLGLMAEDQLISTRIGGKYHKKRLAVEKKRNAGLPPR